MKHSHKLLFVFNLCAALLAFGAISAPAQPARPRIGIEVKPRDNVAVVEGQPRPIGYELLCRGGANAFTFEDRGINKQLPGGETLVVLHLNFKASPHAAGAGGKGLEPGTCSWIDRPLNDKEPREIWFETLANAQLKQALKGTGVDRSPTAAENYPDAISIPAYLSDRNHYWSFFVVNAMSQYFAAQSHQHWKPKKSSLVIKPNDHIFNRVLKP